MLMFNLNFKNLNSRNKIKNQRFFILTVPKLQKSVKINFIFLNWKTTFSYIGNHSSAFPSKNHHPDIPNLEIKTFCKKPTSNSVNPD